MYDNAQNDLIQGIPMKPHFYQIESVKLNFHNLVSEPQENLANLQCR